MTPGADPRDPDRLRGAAPSDDSTPGRSPSAPQHPEERPRNMTALYARVLIVQAVALLALWLLQRTFGGA